MVCRSPFLNLVIQNDSAHRPFLQKFTDITEELLEKVQYYLTNDEEREKIASNGLRRAQTSGYDYHSQLQKMIDIVMSDNT